jgi:hypothetical protein
VKIFWTILSLTLLGTACGTAANKSNVAGAPHEITSCTLNDDAHLVVYEGRGRLTRPDNATISFVCEAGQGSLLWSCRGTETPLVEAEVYRTEGGLRAAINLGGGRSLSLSCQ